MFINKHINFKYSSSNFEFLFQSTIKTEQKQQQQQQLIMRITLQPGRRQAIPVPKTHIHAKHV